MAHRIDSGVERGQPIGVMVDGQLRQAYAGETVATVLLAADVTTFQRGPEGRPRGPFCNMGTCFECLVQVGHDGQPPGDGWVRACMILVEDGMRIATGVDFAQRKPGAAGECV